MTAKSFADMVTIGRIVRPQGRKGEVVVEPLSDRPDRFPSLRQAFVAGDSGAARPVQVRDAWPHKGRFVLKLEGVDSIDEAERYRGLDLRIPEEDLGRIGVPTTLIWGRQDPVMRLKVAEAASARFHWPLHVIDDAGDDPPIERPEAFLRALQSALTPERSQ